MHPEVLKWQKRRRLNLARYAVKNFLIWGLALGAAGTIAYQIVYSMDHRDEMKTGFE